MDYATVEQALWGTGLIARGGFHPNESDGVPAPCGANGTAIVIGNAGGAMWRTFAASPEFRLADGPLDAWTARILGEVAERLAAAAVFPFAGPPHHPFQRWAQRAEAVFPSPIGPLIHPDYGLWHAYRGALLFAERFAVPARPAVQSPCEICTDKPCLTTCPVEAFIIEGYAVPRCVAHIATPAGVDCINDGCRARRACPVGGEYRYVAEQAAFHQRHFRRAYGAPEDPEPGF
ncbi:MAG: ferredoxin [Rhodospirillaceae bacterium]